MALFLLGALFLVGFFASSASVSSGEEYGVLGGPEAVAEEDVAYSPPEFELYNRSSIFINVLDGGYGDPDADLSSGQISDPGQPIGPESRGNLLVYRVQAGDTLSGIAAYFGVSLETLINANPGIRARFIKAGDELNVLPVSGVVYTTKDGDTLESISAYFSVSESQIIQYNEGIDFGSLGVGISLIIPGAKSFNLVQNKSASLPSFGDHFTRPAEGFNWGRLHNYNAVDVANVCGTPIRAAAEGLVIPDSSFGDGRDGWNGGYGRFVLIEHPFGDGVRTRYAHMAKISVSAGDYVEQGEVLGTMGQTGDSSGCHLHFEVYGAANPLAK
ncbi:MAG: peptidoglycan DD-metalloendopeptidase family protein [Patescibacteria group bacterium]